MKQSIFNPLKLPETLAQFSKQRAIVIGVGAVGSSVCEGLAKMGVGRISCLDTDSYTLENVAKMSAIIRSPEDIGSEKAVAAARRTQALMIDGGKAEFAVCDVRALGPYALSRFDVVFLALDNFAAKIYMNQIWLQLPRESRPLLISGGTANELAQSDALDGTECCLRDLIAESWLADSTVHTSCAGPHYRRDADGQEKIVRTSGLASGICANLMLEQFRAHVLGFDAANQSLTYTAYPGLQLNIGEPLPKRSCPDCRRYHPLAQPPRLLKGSVTINTLANTLHQISGALGSEDFELETYSYEWASANFSAVLEQEFCHACGKPLPAYYCHEGRVSYDEVLCPECRAAGKKARPPEAFGCLPVKKLHAFTPQNSTQQALGKMLFALGWPLGGVLTVVQRQGAADLLDPRICIQHFICEGDLERLQKMSLWLPMKGELTNE